jgi:hypothetical protein
VIVEVFFATAVIGSFADTAGASFIGIAFFTTCAAVIGICG